ncbi:MAG: LTA synthase family protein [Methylococcaceae bacterium]|nr:LTA synthase family protein [Methylococcaceae bacterium]
MLDGYSGAIALPLTLVLLGSWLFERLLLPGTNAVWRRHWASLALHAGLCVVMFALVLAVLLRPWFTAMTVLALLMLVIQVNNAKFHALREPFIAQDFEYFTDAIKHPRLYLPFLGIARAVIIGLGFASALYAGLTLEAALTAASPVSGVIAVVLGLLMVGCLLVWLGARPTLPISLQPDTDLWQLGLLASIWRYYQEERRPCPQMPAYAQDAVLTATELPNVVIVQSESFFDARRLYAGIRPEVLAEFSALQAQSAYHGQLAVAAWGANTVRTEFAFLSGLAASALGIHRFNPYRKLARTGIPTLASYCRSLGYRTICVHPYIASFYGRDQIMPKLGFDEFIDITQFKAADYSGPYIGDTALAAKVCSLLQAHASQPVLVFVITMENHGPLHLEQVQTQDLADAYHTLPPDGCDDLSIYVRHLQNADRMAAMLREQLQSLPQPGWLCWYGDHVPIMPQVYQALGTPEGQTDYFIWGKGQTQRVAQDLKVEDLGRVLLRAMGLLKPVP